MANEEIDTLVIRGRPTLAHVDLDALEAFELPDAGGLPPSYVAFIRHAGWARTFGLWLIYPPVLTGYADGLLGRGGHLTEVVRARYAEAETDGYDWVVEPDGSWAMTPSLQVFGWSENGDVLMWDASARGSDGELPVWVSYGMNSLHYAGATLGAALATIRARVPERPAGAGYDVEPLSAVRL